MASWTPINSPKPKPAKNMTSTPKSAKKAQSLAGGSPAVGGEKLTDRELLILSKAWGCMKTQPEVSGDVFLFVTKP